MKKNATTAKLDSDEARPITDADWDRARFRIAGKDASKSEWSAAARERIGKERITIMIDADVLAAYKAKAGDRGYQTLINQALRSALLGDQIEATIRKAIREELHA